jgi:hypothetical protein
MAIEMRRFTFEGWDLLDAIDALVAYDQGAHDSGVSDIDLRFAVVSHLRGLDEDAQRELVARYARRFLTEEAIVAGYGLRDVTKFVEWLSENGITIA